MDTKYTDNRNLCYLTSCTYCCGLNTGKSTKKELTSILINRTKLYNEMVTSKKDVQNYKNEVAKSETWQFMPKTEKELDESNLGELVRCRLIGFLDDKKTKVGCMAYPKNNEDDDTIRSSYTDIHEASMMSGAFGIDASICRNHQCQASTTYKQLSTNLKDIVDLFVENFDWYDISKDHKSSKKSTPLNKLTTLAYFDYVLDKIEEKELSKNKIAITKIINNIGIIAKKIIDLKDNWIYQETTERKIESNKYCMKGLPTGTYWTNSLTNKLSDWKREKEVDSKYKIIINRDEKITLELMALDRSFKKEQIMFIQDGEPISEYATYFVNELKTQNWEDRIKLEEKGLITEEESWFEWDDFSRQYAVNNFKFTRETLFERPERRRQRSGSEETTAKKRLEKVFSHLDSFFVSKQEMNEAKQKIDTIIDKVITDILEDKSK